MSPQVVLDIPEGTCSALRCDPTELGRQRLALEASEDLVEWRERGFVTAAVTGALKFVDADAPNLSHRFYRLRGP